MRLILAILACMLFSCGYTISEYFFPLENLRWHLLRAMIFACSIATAASASLFEINLKYEHWFKFTMYVFITGMIFGDLVDKLYAIYKNENDNFSSIDILFIGISLIISYKKYIYAGKDKTSTR